MQLMCHWGDEIIDEEVLEKFKWHFCSYLTSGESASIWSGPGSLPSFDKEEGFLVLKNWRDDETNGAVVNLGREASEER